MVSLGYMHIWTTLIVLYSVGVTYTRTYVHITIIIKEENWGEEHGRNLRGEERCG